MEHTSSFPYADMFNVLSGHIPDEDHPVRAVTHALFSGCPVDMFNVLYFIVNSLRFRLTTLIAYFIKVDLVLLVLCIFVDAKIQKAIFTYSRMKRS